MFFQSKADANLYAKLQSIQTHRKHKVVRCIKYTSCFLPDGKTKELSGFTIVLKIGGRK